MRLANRRRISCLTCRDRKVKCSGERPGCRTCSSSRRSCRGYGAPLAAEGHAADGDGAPHGAAQGRLLSPMSARTVMRQQLVSLYLSEQLPDEIIAASNGDRNWLLQVPGIETLSPPLEAALFATCLGQRGAGNADLSYQSQTFYGTSLHELQKALNHPSLQYQDQTLATCLALTMYEFAECPGKQPGGYLSHYQGSLELLRRRGPEAHATGLAHSVLRAIRMHAVFRGFQSRSTNFLADKDWLDLPWASKEKDYHDRLVDIMLRLPRIMTQIGGPRQASPQDTLGPAVQRVRACWRVDGELTDWLERLTAATAGPLFWPDVHVAASKLPSAGVGPNTDEPAPTAYSFPSFIFAQTLVLYWLSRMIVSYQLGLAYRQLQALPVPASTPPRSDPECTCRENKKSIISSCLLHFRPTQLPPLGYRANWSETIARHIRRSVDYFFLDKLRVAGPACLMPPLMVLQWHWKHDYSGQDRRSELQWVTESFMRVHARGSKIAEVAASGPRV